MKREKWVLSFKALAWKDIHLGATSLTYYTLLAMVPLLVLFLAIARAFFMEEELIGYLIHKFSAQQEIFTPLLNLGKESLQKVKGGVIGGVGIAGLLYTTFQIIHQLELSLNSLWDSKDPRPWKRRLPDYLALIVLTPLLLVVANGLTVYVSTKLVDVTHERGPFDPLLFLFLHTISYVTNAVLFAFLYLFLPYTKVKIKPACYAALLAAFLYQVFQFLYLFFQLKMSSFDTLYGTLVALPLFLLWIHLSWMIVLFGARCGFFLQNIDAYPFLAKGVQLNFRTKRLLFLSLMHFCVKRFAKEKEPLSAGKIAKALSLPFFLSKRLIDELVALQLLSATYNESTMDVTYQVQKPPETLTIKKILDTIETVGEELGRPLSREEQQIKRHLAHIEGGKGLDISLKDLK